MRSLSEFIVEPLNGKISTPKSKEGFTMSSSIEDHRVSNRVAIIKSVPLGYNGPIEVGDSAIVHHNVFRKYNDVKGREKFSHSMIRSTVYRADLLQVFAFNRNGSGWESVYPYLFFSTDNKHFGKILISSPESRSQGFSEGEKFYYKPGSEYEFRIDDVSMYRVPQKNICFR